MQSTGRPSVVVMKSPAGRYDEGKAAATLKPGYLALMDANGEYIPHGTAAATTTPVCVVTEHMLWEQGKTIADSYADDDWISVWYPNNGDEIQAWIEDNSNIAVGALLESAGDGTLQAVTTGKAIAQAIEAVDTTGGAAAAAQIKVRIVNL